MNYLSLFSGIEAASEAWVPLGWTCVGVAEIEPFPCELLRQRHPNVPNLGDITKITEDDIIMLGQIDLIVFGSPCQDLSVAGARKGLTGARSGLFFKAIDIIRWARVWCDLRWAVWENVPGAFTSNEGRDFAAVVDALRGVADTDVCTDVPPKGWGNEGCAVGEEAMVEWSTLDAQWFGVAQRRRRVFALADFGDWANRPPVLLEPQSLRGNSAPSRRQGQGLAGTLDARTAGGGFPGTDGACNGHVVAQCGSVLNTHVSPTLRAGNYKDKSNPATHADMLVVATLDANYGRLQGCSGQDLNHGHSHLVVQAFGGNNQSGAIDVATALNASGTASGRLDFESETFVVAFQSSQSGVRLDDIHATLDGNNGSRRHNGVLAFSCKDYGADVSIEVAPTMRAMGHTNSHANDGGQLAVLAFNTNAQPDQQVFDEHVTAPLTGSQYAGVMSHMRVRRLTPTECERLQAFRDGHTAIRVGKKQKPVVDGPRYKALGNSMCVNVMRWIGQQIDFVQEWC